MRWTILAVPAFCLLIAGCQDNEARQQNAKLQAELELMKSQQGKGGDDFFKTWAASQQKSEGGDADRKLTTIAEDVRAGLADIQKKIEDGKKDSDKKIDDLDARLKKVTDLETSLASLKGMIESLESKVKNIDANEVLKLHKDLITKEAELTIEKKSREMAQAEVDSLKADLALTRQQVDTLKAEMAGLTGEDISKHPMYTKLRRDLVEAQAERDRARTDFDNLKKEHDELLARVGKGPTPEQPETPKSTEVFDFTGGVVSVSRGTKADAQSILIVSVKTGRVPPIGAELIIRDARGTEVCLAKVTRHWHVGDDNDLPVDELGCTTLNERATRPVANGDQVVWIEKKTEGGGGESRKEGSASGE